MKANPKPQTCLLNFFQGNEISFVIIIPIDSPDMGDYISGNSSGQQVCKVSEAFSLH
jgi:hypothetical protein